jgi:hypothetical protein
VTNTEIGSPNIQSESKYRPSSTQNYIDTSVPSKLVPKTGLSRKSTGGVAKNVAWIRLGTYNYVCRECHGHKERPLKMYKDCSLMAHHFKTECKYRPRSVTANSTPARSPSPDGPSSDSDSSTDKKSRDAKEDPIYLELKSEHDHPELTTLAKWSAHVEKLRETDQGWRSLNRRWACRPCKDNGAPLVTWSSKGWVRNHWIVRCKFNPRRIGGKSLQVPSPAVSLGSQVFGVSETLLIGRKLWKRKRLPRRPWWTFPKGPPKSR